MKFVVSSMLALVFVSIGMAQGVQRPNIILAMADDQGWRDVAYNASPDRGLKTPNLDRMAATGIRFDRFYASSPNCAPTRAGVLTGRYCQRAGVFNPGFCLRPGELTIADVLKASGYHTAHFGKWHLGPVKSGSLFDPHARGFEYYLSHFNFFNCDPSLSRNGAPPEEIKGEGSEVLVSEMLKYVDTIKEDGKPFFAVIWFGSCHNKHTPLPEYKDLYKDLPEEWANYYGEITGLDNAMGNLMDGLKERGIDKNTLIWYTSDNGSYAPADTIQGLRGFKGTTWDGGVRVPGIIVWPERVTKPIQTSFFASTLDIMPTILELLDITVENRELDGMSILPVIDGKEAAERTKPMPFWRANELAASSRKNNKSLYTKEQLADYWHEYDCPNFTKPPSINTGDAAWIEGKWKLHKIRGNKIELYNIVEDMGEAQDVSSKYPEIVADLTDKLEAWQRSANLSLAGGDNDKNPVVIVNGRRLQF